MTQHKHIEVVPYRSEWPKLFEEESRHIQKALGDNCVAVHHVGSTAVPGLASKPKIDIIAVVKNPVSAIPALEAIGFQYRGEYNIPMHYGFSKRGKVAANLHVYEEGHPEIEWNLLFRDYLREHSDVRDAYASLKMDLLRDKTSFERSHSRFPQYTLRKGDFIRSVLKKAGFNRLRMLRCSDETEWRAAKELARNNDLAPQPDQEHLILYRGVEIVGYAHLQLLPVEIKLLVTKDPKDRSEFLTFIHKWMKQLNLKEDTDESHDH